MQLCVQGFYFESVDFKKAINMFDHVEKSVNIYEGVIEPSYKTKTYREEAIRSVHRKKIRFEAALSNINK